MTKAEYTLQLMVGGVAPRWSTVALYPDDATAIAESRRRLAAETAILRGRTSMLVGRGCEPEVRWLGAWHLADEPEWMPAD